MNNNDVIISVWLFSFCFFNVFYHFFLVTLILSVKESLVCFTLPSIFLSIAITFQICHPINIVTKSDKIPTITPDIVYT